jgi:hypothetical protein
MPEPPTPGEAGRRGEGWREGEEGGGKKGKGQQGQRAGRRAGSVMEVGRRRQHWSAKRCGGRLLLLLLRVQPRVCMFPVLVVMMLLESARISANSCVQV